MDYLNELLLKLEFIVERLFPKSQKKSERLQDLFQKKFGATEPCHPHPSSTVKICRFAAECTRQCVCGDYLCRRECVFCRKIDCRTLCSAYSPLSCKRIESPPYVCNVCQLRRGCACDRAYYVATQAHAVAMRRYSESRSKPQTHGDELTSLDKLVAPLIKKGQPLTHIYAAHREQIPVSERTLYRYIDAGMLGVGNLDLRRKVSYSISFL